MSEQEKKEHTDLVGRPRAEKMTELKFKEWRDYLRECSYTDEDISGIFREAFDKLGL